VTEIFSQPDDAGPARASEAETSLWGRLGAQAADTLDPKDSLSGVYIGRRIREGIAGGFAAHDWDGVGTPEQQMALQGIEESTRSAIPDISQGDAKLLLKQEGLTEQDVHLGDQETHKLPVLKMQIDEAHTRRDRQAAIERGPQGFFPGALGLVTSLGVGMIDPVNAAAFSIPVIGEARMGKIIASAGDSILARGAARFGQGAAQGAAGTAVLQPADWWLHTRDGQDYTMAQAMESIIMGAGMGGVFHAIPGGVGDVLARRRGLPLAGSPQDLLLRGLMTGTHVHADQLAEEGVPIDEVPGIAPVIAPSAPEAFPEAPMHPADVLADLPPAAKEDAVHAAMADIIAGRPTQAAEMLDIAADHDPRIAESFEAFHGSPHDVDRFDSSRIGTGEGAQTYGHGLYFAENEKVAAKYARSTSGQDFIRKAQELYDEHDSPDDAHEAIADSKDFTPGQKRLLLALEKDDWLGFDYPHQAVSAALSDPNGRKWEMSPETLDAIKHVGHMYRVKINANQEHLLDWDKPIGEQSDHVRSALAKLGYDEKVATRGEDVYRQLGHEHTRYGEPDQNGMRRSLGPKDASAALREAGIPGIRYLDQGSRAGALAPAYRAYEEGGEFYVADKKPRAAGPFTTMKEAQDWIAGQATRNFVVFNDKHIEITHKNGEPVKKEELVKEHALQQAKENAAKTARGRAAADPKTWSLFEYLASRGGLKPDPELTAIFGTGRGPFVPGFGPLIRKGGMALDNALVAAKEGSYVHDVDQLHAPHVLVDAARRDQPLTVDINDMLRLFDENARGQKTYRADHVAETKFDPAHESHLVLAELEHDLEASGAKVENIDPKLLDRTVEIVKRDGESDVLAAYERAIMEDAERYDATAHKRHSEAEAGHIPGWDAADAGATPRDGQGGPGERGPAGRPDETARGADGQKPRGDGRGDRSSPAVAAADPRWRQLADATPDYNDPETLAESEAADHVPEPDSLVPERSLTALEKAAADAEEVWRKLEPTLTEKERALVNDVMNQLKLDAETRAKIITDGAACLVGAVG
jgi:hypothetical protein